MKAAQTLIYVLSSISTNCFDNGETGRKTTGLEAEKYCGPVSKTGISDRSKTPSYVVGQNNELSPSLPGENIELSPSLPGENNELLPSSVVGQNNDLSPSLPGENIELTPPLPGENNELSPSSVVAEHRGPSCPLVVGENPTFS